MYYYDEGPGIGETILGTLFISGMFYLNRLAGRQEAYDEIEKKKQKEDIEMLKEQVAENKRQKDIIDELRATLKAQNDKNARKQSFS